MRTGLLVVLCLIVAATSGRAQSHAGQSVGDTAWVVVHHVAGTKRAVYEQWMADVWGKTAAEIAAKDADFRAAMQTRQRFTPTRSQQDSTWTYISIYHQFPAPAGKSGGLSAVFAAAGWPKAKIDAELEKMKSVIVRSEAGPMLEQTSWSSGEAR